MTGIHQDLSETNPPVWDENKGPRGPWGTQREERIVSYGRGWGCRCGDWASGCTQMQRTSDAKVVLLYDLSVPEVQVVLKGNKYSQKVVLTDVCSGALALHETNPVT